jgi:AbrB family looped-hinge helix DNA binding protein
VNGKATLDRAGRLVLPKPVREALRVDAGDSFDVTTDGDRVILSPVRIRPGLQKERGIWVYRSGKPSNASIPDLIDETRRQRSRELTGG